MILESAPAALVWHAGMGRLFIGFRSRRPSSAAMRAGNRKNGTSAPEQLGGFSAPGWRPTCRVTLPEVQARSSRGRLCTLGRLSKSLIWFMAKLTGIRHSLQTSPDCCPRACHTVWYADRPYTCVEGESPTPALPFTRRRRVLGPLPISTVRIHPTHA